MPAKKTAAKKSPAKKAAPKKSPAKKSLAKKGAAKKAVAKKAAPKKSPARKTTAKSAVKALASKAPVKKAIAQAKQASKAVTKKATQLKTAVTKAIAPAKKSVAKASATMTQVTETVESFVGSLETWAQDIAKSVSAFVSKEASQAASMMKWGHPVWDHKGPFVLLKPSKNHVTLGFWRGAELDDPSKLLEKGKGPSAMRYIKVKSGAALPEGVADLIRQAASLNEQHGDPLAATK